MTTEELAEEIKKADIEALNTHLKGSGFKVKIKPDSGGTCPPGYYLNSKGVCVPDIGG